MEKSTLGLPKGSIRAMLAMALTGTVLILVCMEKPVPDGLSHMVGMVLAFYFGTKVKDN